MHSKGKRAYLGLGRPFCSLCTHAACSIWKLGHVDCSLNAVQVGERIPTKPSALELRQDECISKRRSWPPGRNIRDKQHLHNGISGLPGPKVGDAGRDRLGGSTPACGHRGKSPLFGMFQPAIVMSCSQACEWQHYLISPKHLTN